MTRVEKVALVTGANKGIGLEIARGLGQRGFSVLIGARDQARGLAAERQLRAEKLDATWLALDVTDRDSIARAVEVVSARPGRLDVLVNNAGIASRAQGADAAAIFTTNVVGLADVTLAFLPLLERSAGQVINLSSYLGSFARTSAADSEPARAAVMHWAYAASKSAVNALTVHWARAFAERPVRVNAGCPGFCATDLNDHQGPRSAAQGAAIAVRLATEADGGSGRLLNDAGVVPW